MTAITGIVGSRMPTSYDLRCLQLFLVVRVLEGLIKVLAEEVHLIPVIWFQLGRAERACSPIADHVDHIPPRFMPLPEQRRVERRIDIHSLEHVRATTLRSFIDECDRVLILVLLGEIVQPQEEPVRERILVLFLEGPKQRRLLGVHEKSYALRLGREIGHRGVGANAAEERPHGQ